MSNEPTPGEVARALDQFRRDVHDDFETLHSDLRDGLAGVKNRIIFRDVYDADERRRQDELAALRATLDTERKAAQAWRDKRDANRKWLISAVVLPIGGVIVEIINLLKGSH